MNLIYILSNFIVRLNCQSFKLLNNKDTFLIRKSFVVMPFSRSHYCYSMRKTDRVYIMSLINLIAQLSIFYHLIILLYGARNVPPDRILNLKIPLVNCKCILRYQQCIKIFEKTASVQCSHIQYS